MKASTILSLSALFMASLTSAVMPDLPNKIDTCVTPGVVAWTFDDGPGPFTDTLLTILAKHNAKATFFVLGTMLENPTQAALLKKMLDAGHQIASHTYSHSIMDTLTVEKQQEEITKTSDLIFKNAGVRPAYMRAPQGECGDVCTKTMEGMKQVISHWNADTNDWRYKSSPNPTVQSLTEVQNILGKSDPATDSFILLQHDIHEFSVKELADQVAEEIKKRGFRFVTMEECVGTPAYLEGAAPKPSGNNGGTPTNAKGAGGAAPSPTTPSSASVKQLSAWAMGVVVLAGTLMF